MAAEGLGQNGTLFGGCSEVEMIELRNARARARELLVRRFEKMKDVAEEAPSAEDFFPVPLEEIVGQIGWRLEEVGALASVGALCRTVEGECDYTDHTIRVAVDEADERRRRFTLAHEIGHAVLHEGLGDKRQRISSRRRVHSPGEVAAFTRSEREANVFATELLMPERAVRERFRKVLGRDKVTVSQALKIVGSKSNVDRSRRNNYAEAAGVAKEVASYLGEEGSLRDFFEVSVDAMASRIMELRLIILH